MRVELYLCSRWYFSQPGTELIPGPGWSSSTLLVRPGDRGKLEPR